jgi:hypothetical protein
MTRTEDIWVTLDTVSWGAGASDFLPILFLLAATVLLMVGVMNLSFGRL